MLEPPVAPPLAAPLQCPGCGRGQRERARYCAGCGYTLTSSAAPPAQLEVTERPSTAPRVAAQWNELKRVAWLYGLLLLSSFLLGIAARFDETPLPEAVASAVDALLVLAFAASRPAEVLALLGAPRVGPGQALRLVGVSLLCMAGLATYFEALSWLGIPLIRYSDDFLAAGWPLWSLFVMVSVVPAVFEELALRGVIQPTLERVVGVREALLIQAGLFAVLHLMPVNFPSHALMGLWFGMLRNQTGSLYPGMLAHASWNALVIGEELWSA
jgi:membrane protease YdiL (CAAX protease family)